MGNTTMAVPSAGIRKYCRKQKMKTASGTAAIITKVMRPEKKRQSRYQR